MARKKRDESNKWKLIENEIEIQCKQQPYKFTLARILNILLFERRTNKTKSKLEAILWSISSTFYVRNFRTNVVSAAYMYLEKAAKTTFVWKICT